MLAPRLLPAEYKQWNAQWGAPFGHAGFGWPLRGTRFDIRRRGPFAHQGNNSIREFEYPWAYQQIAQHGSRLSILDIGGSLGGMQFVLSRLGHSVKTIDPGLKAGGLGWDVDVRTHELLNRLFGTQVEIVPESLANAKLPAQCADVVLCVSSLEHFSDEDLFSTAHAIPYVLKDAGLAVMTVDCFLDLSPFTKEVRNKWGRNISVFEFLRQAGLQLNVGNRSELVGFPEFDPINILSQLATYHVGNDYPCLAQCFTATKTRTGATVS